MDTTACGLRLFHSDRYGLENRQYWSSESYRRPLMAEHDRRSATRSRQKCIAHEGLLTIQHPFFCGQRPNSAARAVGERPLKRTVGRHAADVIGLDLRILGCRRV